MIVLSFLLLVLVIGALVDVVRAPVGQIKAGTKAGWLLAVLLLPVFGGALWFAFGRRRGSYDLDEYAEDGTDGGRDALPSESSDRHDPERAAERIRSVDGPVERLDDPPQIPASRQGPRTTEEQLADLEAEIAYWEEWSAQNSGRPAGSGTGQSAGEAPRRD